MCVSHRGREYKSSSSRVRVSFSRTSARWVPIPILKHAELGFFRSLLQLHLKIDDLQSQVGTLVKTIDTLMPDLKAPSGSTQPPRFPQNGGPGPQAFDVHSSNEPAYVGPTSFAFGLDVPGVDLRPAFSRKDFRDGEGSSNAINISKEHAYRMIELFEETIGDMYPCVDFGAIRRCASTVFDEPPEIVYRRLYQRPSPLSTFDRDFEILRATLANGLVLDGHGQSGSGAVMMDRIETIMYNRVKVFEVDTKELLLLLLMACFPRAKAITTLIRCLEPLPFPLR